MSRHCLFLTSVPAFGLLPTLACAQTLGQAGDDGISIGRVLAALIFCLMLGAGALVAIRKWGRDFAPFQPLPKKARRLHLHETLRINQHVQLCLVACDGQDLLLAVSAQGVQMLSPSSSPLTGLTEVEQPQ